MSIFCMSPFVASQTPHFRIGITTTGVFFKAVSTSTPFSFSSDALFTYTAEAVNYAWFPIKQTVNRTCQRETPNFTTKS